MESDAEEDSRYLVESAKKLSLHSHQSSHSHDGHISNRSQKSQSHISAWEKDHTNPEEDWTVSQSSFKSSSRRSDNRNRNSQNTGKSRYGRSQERHPEEGDSEHGGHTDRAHNNRDQLSVQEEAEESTNDTSMDETSFSTSTSTDKENGSSSELSIDPIVWKKFKFLTSILKETQHNLKAMDDLVLEHRHLQELSDQRTTHTSASYIPGTEQELGDGEPKTDEAKLEEILSLLHNLTRTLSSYEQHPLLAAAQQPTNVPLTVPLGDALPTHASQELQPSSPEAKAPNSQGYGSHNLDSHTYRLPEFEQTSDRTHLQLPSHCGYQDHSSLPRYDEFSLRFDTSKDGTVGYQDTSSRYNSSIPHALPQGSHVSNNPTYTNVGILSLENGPRAVPQSLSNSFLRERDGETHVNMSDDHMAAHDASHYFRTHVKDSISQTDYAFSGPNVYESYESPNVAGQFQPDAPHQSSRITTCQSQGTTSHPLTRETRSLRKDINDIVLRKQALDSRLQSLIAHRAVQKEMEWTQAAKSKDKKQIARSHSLEDDSRRLKGKLKKYRSRSKSQEDEVDSHSRMSSSVKDCYLSMISEDQDEFPSLQMGSLENDEKISELRNEEADLPGLGDSGLSSEINSINATIQELVRENQQLHEFLQGMTVESIAKVDQEKIELEAKIQSLNQENESLKILMNENSQEGETDASAKKKHEGKAVSFLVSDDSVEKLLEKHEMESAHCQELVNRSPVPESVHIQNDVIDISGPLRLGQEATVGSQEHAQRIAVLEAQVRDLTSQNHSLMHEVRKEKNADASDKELQSDCEGMSSPLLDPKTQSSANLSVTKEIEKLQRKINRLLREKEDLNHKLNTESTERDYENSRLEARIRILSEQNKVLSDKLNEQKSTSLTTDHVSYHSDQVKSHGNSSISVRMNQDKFDEKSTDDSKSAMNTGVASSREISFKKDVDYVNLTEDDYEPKSKVDSESSLSREVSEHSRSRSTEYSSSRGETKHTISKGSNASSSTKRDSEYTRSEPEYSHTEDPEYSSSTKDSKYTRSDDAEHGSSFRQLEYTGNSASCGSRQSAVSEQYISDRGTKKSTFDENDEDSQADDNSSTNIEHSLHTENIDQSTSVRLPCKSSKTIGYESHDKKKDKSSPEALHGYNRKSKTDEVKPYTIVQPVNDPRLTSQLEELLKQNEMLISTVNAMKATTVISESSLGSTIKQIMEEHEKLMQNIEEKIGGARISGELDAELRVNKLLQEKQELALSLEEQKHKNESLVKQNDLLEKKLQHGRKNSNEFSEHHESSDKDKEVICYVKTPPTLRIASEEKNAPYDIEVDCEIIESFKVSEEIVNGSDDLKKREKHRFQQNKKDDNIFKANRQTLERKDAFKRTDLQKQATTTLDSQSKSSSRRNSLSLQSLSRRGSQASPSRMLRSDAQEHEEELQDELTEGMIPMTTREDEKWAQVLEQSEEEKQFLQDRIKALVNENDCLASRLEEVMGVSRNLSDQMHSAREELVKVSAEKEDLQKKVRSLEEGKEDSSLSLSESLGSSRLTQRLKERIRSLQGEVEGAWQEVHQRTIERDKICAERESIEYTASINLNSAKKEVESLRSQIAMHQQDFERRAVELTNTKNELEKKSSEQRILLDDFEVQKKKLRELEKKLEAVESAYEECQEKLQLEIRERKSTEEQLEETLQRLSAGLESERTRSKGERYWQEAVSRLKSQLHQEQLRSRLLEAADHENSARIVVLQRSVRETIEAHEILQAKYKQLRTAYRAKKTDKTHHRQLSEQYSQQVKELGKTSAALEDNYKY
ncbi:COP1-interactive protein 1-like isoform X3 [Penaeus japonicus]|uniref:COP1-interactive protein 1-like isoform X3 n=1 Tax=Penaeus japonicus TaxID=27405 RepID=UPI001C70DDF8|nr:COP1-interactive protein 1-like isoform X3 [Penaeus japonicus]